MSRLADIAQINPRQEKAVDDGRLVSFLSMADVSEEGSTTPGETREYREVRRGYTPFQRGDVLVAKITPCFQNGKIAQALTEHHLGFGSTEFHVIRPDSAKADTRYVMHLLRTPVIRIAGERFMTGSGGQRRVPPSYLGNLEVPLPPLPEQRRIAAILDQADELRAKRRRTLALLDYLPEQIFAETFLSAGRAQSSLEELATWQAGGTPSRSEHAYFSGDIPWMTSGELGPIRASASKEMLTSDAIAHSSAKMIPEGSLLLGMYDSAALKSSISVGRVSCNQAVAFGVPLVDVSPEFLYFAVQSQRASVLARRRGARQKNLNLSMIRSITVPDASAAERLAFARTVNRIETLRRAAEAHLAHLDELFASLQHRAFTGQL
ncbi:restriction endonuclease subunit S [Frigoribacterium sp. 2-23]|uniref:restriction endonuclease subunit S n=1 Tax=Frigoribacterium sp. 2-23 TaxID=3415006 RepID=UPI003C6F8ECD